jgi:hypothetical protein
LPFNSLDNLLRVALPVTFANPLTPALIKPPPGIRPESNAVSIVKEVHTGTYQL